MGQGLILTVGNEAMGDDGAGPLLAKLLHQNPLPEWEVLNGGSAPENHLHRIRELQPPQVVIVDAADMGLTPGAVCPLSEDAIADQFIFTTHDMPLSFLIEALKEFVPRVHFIGIQPDVVAFAYPMSPPVRQAVDAVYEQLQLGSWNNR
ncbi:MAG TPA: hydrogenase maturation peptidase HycI [Anaerolineae bacterium]|nr:hydrogenase maturation peptidase HycI [Anaerolineae bacterium]